MSFIDRLYVYCYAMLLKTGSRSDARNTAALCVAVVFLMHFLGLAFLSSLSSFDVLAVIGKFGAVLAGFLIIGLSAFRYIVLKHGESLLRTFVSEVHLKKTFLIGTAIFVWSVCFPFVAIAALILLRPYHP